MMEAPRFNERGNTRAKKNIRRIKEIIFADHPPRVIDCPKTGEELQRAFGMLEMEFDICLKGEVFITSVPNFWAQVDSLLTAFEYGFASIEEYRTTMQWYNDFIAQIEYLIQKHLTKDPADIRMKNLEDDILSKQRRVDRALIVQLFGVNFESVTSEFVEKLESYVSTHRKGLKVLQTGIKEDFIDGYSQVTQSMANIKKLLRTIDPEEEVLLHIYSQHGEFIEQWLKLYADVFGFSSSTNASAEERTYTLRDTPDFEESWNKITQQILDLFR